MTTPTTPPPGLSKTDAEMRSALLELYVWLNLDYANEIIGKIMDHVETLEAHNKALREALEAMLFAYAPGVDRTIAECGEKALHSAVRKARQALAATAAGKEGGEE